MRIAAISYEAGSAERSIAHLLSVFIARTIKEKPDLTDANAIFWDGQGFWGL